jgi:hypothetical protein
LGRCCRAEQAGYGYGCGSRSASDHLLHDADSLYNSVSIQNNTNDSKEISS